MTTTAEKISDRYNNDGTNFTDADDVNIGQACEESTNIVYRHPEDTRDHRYVFADNSVITFMGEAWDIGYPNCWCWQGAGHTEECTNQ